MNLLYPYLFPYPYLLELVTDRFRFLLQTLLQRFLDYRHRDADFSGSISLGARPRYERADAVLRPMRHLLFRRSEDDTSARHRTG